MKTKFTPKSEQQMRKEINEVYEQLTSVMLWARLSAIEDKNLALDSVADTLFNCLEKLNKV